jgi:hypothetical protein
MHRPEYEALREAAQISKMSNEFMSWLKDWYAEELRKLPYATSNAAQSQGRCQALQELIKFLEKAPEMSVAKPDNRKPQVPTHTDRSV